MFGRSPTASRPEVTCGGRAGGEGLLVDARVGRSRPGPKWRCDVRAARRPNRGLGRVAAVRSQPDRRGGGPDGGRLSDGPRRRGGPARHARGPPRGSGDHLRSTPRRPGPGSARAGHSGRCGRSPATGRRGPVEHHRDRCRTPGREHHQRRTRRVGHRGRRQARPESGNVRLPLRRPGPGCGDRGGRGPGRRSGRPLDRHPTRHQGHPDDPRRADHRPEPGAPRRLVGRGRRCRRGSAPRRRGNRDGEDVDDGVRVRRPRRDESLPLPAQPMGSPRPGPEARAREPATASRPDCSSAAWAPTPVAASGCRPRSAASPG